MSTVQSRVGADFRMKDAVQELHRSLSSALVATKLPQFAGAALFTASDAVQEAASFTAATHPFRIVHDLYD